MQLVPPQTGALIGQTLGPYQVLGLLAVGGTAEVYYGRTSTIGGFQKFVVIKAMHEHLADDPEFIRMFLDEARLAAMLGHSNIVQTFDLGQHRNRYYLVMELLSGLSLSMIMKLLNGARMPAALALNMIAQAAQGLHYAHELRVGGQLINVVHRDVSPQNLVVTFDGVVKLVDFGIARSDHRETKTQAGTVKGKFAYMSPEQCVAGAVDRRSDVFSLGVVLYELLAQQRLFKRGNPYETYRAAIACEVPLLSSLGFYDDPELDALVAKALAKRQDDRYATAEDMSEAIIAYLHRRNLSWRPADVADYLRTTFPTAVKDSEQRTLELTGGQELTSSTLFDWGGEEVSIVELSELGVLRPSDVTDPHAPERFLEARMQADTAPLRGRGGSGAASSGAAGSDAAGGGAAVSGVSGRVSGGAANNKGAANVSASSSGDHPFTSAGQAATAGVAPAATRPAAPRLHGIVAPAPQPTSDQPARSARPSTLPPITRPATGVPALRPTRSPSAPPPLPLAASPRPTTGTATAVPEPLLDAPTPVAQSEPPARLSDPTVVESGGGTSVTTQVDREDPISPQAAGRLLAILTDEMRARPEALPPPPRAKTGSNPPGAASSATSMAKQSTAVSSQDANNANGDPAASGSTNARTNISIANLPRTKPSSDPPPPLRPRPATGAFHITNADRQAVPQPGAHDTTYRIDRKAHPIMFSQVRTSMLSSHMLLGVAVVALLLIVFTMRACF